MALELLPKQEAHRMAPQAQTQQNGSNGATKAQATPPSTHDAGRSTQPLPGARPAGASFDLVQKTGEVEGKAQWEKLGTLFLRANASGGVVYLKLGDKELQVAVFPKRPRK